MTHHFTPDTLRHTPDTLSPRLLISRGAWGSLLVSYEVPPVSSGTSQFAPNAGRVASFRASSRLLTNPTAQKVNVAALWLLVHFLETQGAAKILSLAKKKRN